MKPSNDERTKSTLSFLLLAATRVAVLESNLFSICPFATTACTNGKMFKIRIADATK